MNNKLRHGISPVQLWIKRMVSLYPQVALDPRKEIPRITISPPKYGSIENGFGDGVNQDG